MKKTHKKHLSAFTLIELIVVIAIIALLTAIVLANLATPKAKSRDAKRISDLAQIQLALELFYDRCNAYPRYLDPSETIPGYCPAGITLGSFISAIPQDPSPGGYYLYVTDSQYYTNSAYNNNSNPGSPPENYTLWAKLETINNAAALGNSSGAFYLSNWFPAGFTGYTYLPDTITPFVSIAGRCNISSYYYCVGPR